MANINKALETLFKLEFNSKKNVLHKNKFENGYTFYGIYQSAHPQWDGWKQIEMAVKAFQNIEMASLNLADNMVLKAWVEDFYKNNFWDVAKLDEVKSQHIAEEIFIFGVNVGMKVAVMKAQKLVGAIADGFVGNQTLKKLNDFDEEMFDILFDNYEQDYYEAIIKNKPYLTINRRGWLRRSEAV